ncbi:short-chain dehydrogenase/reductase family 42E member 1-like isoform X2 [Scylla paramamosain]|uniref:short-chain dehydrogenase/reductase family 42E member 1-like isoform X2 n=1 Tax=Scylla paramamosain TaxID=85552 RepID=UPI003082E22C
MRVVVTGGGGYVGYHVGWALSQGGHDVTLLDLQPPDPEWRETAPRALWDALPRGFWGEGQQHPGSLEFVRGSVTDFKILERHFQGASAVVHSASYGMSGREQLPPHAPLQEKVNVEGTREVIRAAVRALVYTSTYNVVFGGRQIAEGDESLPFFSLHAHTDHYSRTKTIAEMLVLMADGKCGPPACHSLPPALQQGHASSPGTPQPCLRTCALRMNGVMGLGEKKHTRRVMNAIRSGLLILAYGRKEGLVDFIGIQNVVQGHVKALMALLREQSFSTQDFPATLPSPCKIVSCERLDSTDFSSSLSDGSCSVTSSDTSGSLIPASLSRISSSSVTSSLSPGSYPLVSGQAFFISDSAPVSHFEYFRPLFEGLGYSFPAVTLPLCVILLVAYLQEFVYCLVHRFLPFTPFVTPAEAYKSGVTHYCSCRKATRAFDYFPTRPNDLKQVVEYYRAQGCTKTHKTGIVSLLPLALFFILPVFILLIVL